MKILKLVTTILITLSILLTGYFSFSFATSGQEVINTGVTLVLLFFLVIVLLSFRLSLTKDNEKLFLPSTLTILLIIGLGLMYFQRPWIESLWNYTLAGFILLQGVNLMRTISMKSKTGKPVQILTAITILFITALCLIKIDTPFLFYIAGIALVLTSIGIIINEFLGKSNQST